MRPVLLIAIVAATWCGWSGPGWMGSPAEAATAASAVAGAGTAVPGYLLPVAGPAVVLTAFRPPAVRWGAGHRGVDLAAAVGAAVRSAGPGTVVFAGAIAGRGVVSVLHSPGLRTTYEPVTTSVRAGQVVGAGAVLGVVQAGHPTCRPQSCLHWGARAGPDEYLDPMLLLSRWRVRLLPWDGTTS